MPRPSHCWGGREKVIAPTCAVCGGETGRQKSSHRKEEIELNLLKIGEEGKLIIVFRCKKGERRGSR